MKLGPLCLCALTVLMSVVARSQEDTAAIRYAFTTIEFPGAKFTAPYAINSTGEIIGQYVDSNFVYHGFTLYGTTFRSLDFPGASHTALSDVNDSGEIVGSYQDATGEHGFKFSGGRFATFDSSQFIFPTGINNRGDIVGIYFLLTGLDH